VPDLSPVFTELHNILAPYAAKLSVTRDDPETLYVDTQHVSPELKARMQGKSCFNFRALEPALFKELSTLTKASYASYKEQGFVP